jgi:hypothetical protein
MNLEVVLNDLSLNLCYLDVLNICRWIFIITIAINAVLAALNALVDTLYA